MFDDWPGLAPCCWLLGEDEEGNEVYFFTGDDEDEDEEEITLH